MSPKLRLEMHFPNFYSHWLQIFTSPFSLPFSLLLLKSITNFIHLDCTIYYKYLSFLFKSSLMYPGKKTWTHLPVKLCNLFTFQLGILVCYLKAKKFLFSDKRTLAPCPSSCSGEWHTEERISICTVLYGSSTTPGALTCYTWMFPFQTILLQSDENIWTI